jgi:hypothetical protein
VQACILDVIRKQLVLYLSLAKDRRPVPAVARRRFAKRIYRVGRRPRQERARSIGSTNPIEFLNARYRRATKARGHFPASRSRSHATTDRPSSHATGRGRPTLGHMVDAGPHPFTPFQGPVVSSTTDGHLP